MGKKKDPTVQLLYIGQWIEWINENYNETNQKYRVGRIIEIEGNGTLIVRSDGYSYKLKSDRVVKAFPFFTVLPIPAKLDKREI